nr:hypothetical protein [Streptomyces sp. SID4946]
MQGQMHVHATEMDSPVPLLGHFSAISMRVSASGIDILAALPVENGPVLSVSVTVRVLREAF